MSYLGVIERTVHRHDGSERTIIGQVMAEDSTSARRMLESIADRDPERTSQIGHHSVSTWERGSYWVCQTCHVHLNFGLCYTEWQYRLLPTTDADAAVEAAAAKAA